MTIICPFLNKNLDFSIIAVPVEEAHKAGKF